MANITKEHALAIVKKLKAIIKTRKKAPHDKAIVYEGDRLIASFHIRRGSKKNSGHDFIPEQIYINAHKTKLLAQCNIERDEWLDILREKGKL